MPDTFDVQYNWFKTWQENPHPPILFYGTSCNLIHEIREHGLTPKMEKENNPTAVIQHILQSARKLGDKRTTEQAELILLEHGERPGPLKLTFNYHHACYLARKKTRQLEAVQWLCETFKKRTESHGDPDLSKLAIHRLSYSCKGMCDLYLGPAGVVVYVRTDLSKFQNLPPLLEDKKALKKAMQRKSPIHRNHWPKISWWKKLAKSEMERYLEKSIRGNKDHPGLGEEILTPQLIPPSDIVRLELPPHTSIE